MSNAERIRLLREAQALIREAMSKITAAADLDKPEVQYSQGYYDRVTEAQDWRKNYTFVYLSKVVDNSNELSDIGNIDSLIDWFDD